MFRLTKVSKNGHLIFTIKHDGNRRTKPEPAKIPQITNIDDFLVKQLC